MKFLAVCLSLAVSMGLDACQATEGVEPASGTDAAPAPNLIGSAAGLVGEYRVAGVDGGDIDLPHGITATITADRIDVTSDCIRLAWNYRFENGALSTEAVPMPSCRRALLPEEAAVAEAFEQAGMVRRTPANGIEFAGGERSVLLFNQ